MIASKSLGIWGACAFVALLAGCSDDPKRPVGGSCESDEQCVSGICGGSLCLDPASDDDLDGLINSLEKTLGSDPTKADSDDDGIDDAAEIASDLSSVDTDGDGALDILESSTADQDDDCIPDQYDAQDTVSNGDLSPLIKVVCADTGPCQEQRAVLSVSCATGAATCVYDRVEGYADPEVACDGVDENCDGTTDEGFAAGCVDDDWDDDGVADADDVCPEVVDPGQADVDGDGIGDACIEQYEIAFVAPLPPTTIVATASFDVHAVVRRKAADGERPAAPTFKGAVELTSLPDEALLDTVTANGPIAFEGVALTLVGTWRLQISAAIGSAESEPIVVSPGPLAAIVIDAPAAVAGQAIDVSAEALDAFGNRVEIDDVGAFSTSDPDAEIPEGAGFDKGVWAMGGLVLHRAGTTTLTLRSGGVTGTADVVVSAGEAAALAVVLAEDVKAGVATSVVVNAVDASGNMTTRDGVAALSSTDPRVTVANVTLSGGTGTIDVVFGSVGERTLTATLGAIEGVATTTVRAGSPAGIVLTAPDTVAATPSTIVVTIVDMYGQVANDPGDTYLGTVSFDLSGPAPARAPSLPGATTFTAADASRREVVATWFSAGTWTLRATGTDLESNIATAVVEVAAGTIGAIEVTLAATSRAGIETDLTITAVDLGGNRVSFVGDVTLADDDSQSDLPATLAFTSGNQGRRTLPVTFGTVGLRTVTVGIDTITAQATTTVSAGAPEAIVLSQTGDATTGIPHAVHVAVVDSFGNIANAEGDSFVGTMTFAAVPAPAVAPTLPGPTAFVAADLSERDITTTWFSAGEWQLRASATGLTAGLLAIEITPGTATTLEVIVPATAKAGVAVDVTVRALDASGNVDPTFNGTATLTDTDAQSDLPVSIEIAAGTHTIPVVFGTVGTQTISATAGTLSDDAATIVRAGTPHHLVLTTTGTTEVGVAKGVHVAAVDQFGNVANDPATLYLGTVSFDVTTAPPVAPTLPAATAFIAANRSERDVQTTWRSPGSYTLRATGTGLAVTVATLPVVVTGSATTRFEVALPDAGTVGTAVALTVSARDAAGNVDAAFVGTVTLADDDDQSNLPASVVFAAADNGTRTLQVTFGTAGLRTVTASLGALTGSDTITIAGTTTALRITAPASMVAGSAQSGTVEAVNAQGALDPSFSGTAVLSGNAQLPASVTLTNGTATLPLPLTTAGTFTIVATAGAITGQRGITVTHAAAADLRVSSSAPYIATGKPFPVTAEIIDVYGNTATSFVGDVVVEPTDGSSGGVISITAQDLGRGSTDITMGSTGEWFINFTTTTPEMSKALAVTVYSGDPSRIEVLAPTGPVYVDEPFFVEVWLRDGDGALAISDDVIFYSVRAGVSYPHAGQLANTDAQLPAGMHGAYMELMFTKAGVFSIEAVDDVLDGSETDTFEVYYRPPTVEITNTSIDAGCVSIDYTTTQANDRPLDIKVELLVDDGTATASQAPATVSTRGNLGVPPGSDTFGWNAPLNLPHKFNDVSTLRMSARVADDFVHPFVQSEALDALVDLSQQLSVDEHQGVGTLSAIAVGDVDGDGRDDVAYSAGTFLSVVTNQLQTIGSDVPYGELDIHDFDFDYEGEIAVIMEEEVAIFRSGAIEPAWLLAPCGDGEAPFDVAFGDFDGQDDDDLAILCSQPDGFEVELWRFGSDWELFERVSNVGRPRSFAVADLSYDGIDDLVVATSTGLVSAIGHGNPFKHDLMDRLIIGDITHVATGDLSFDGYADVIAVRADGVALRSDNTHVSANPFTSTGEVPVDGARDVVITDIDHDAQPDLVFATATGVLVRSLDGTAVGVPGVAYDRVAAGADRVIVKTSGAASFAYGDLYAAPPALCRATPQSAEATPPWLDRDRLVAADFDDDGRIDLAGDGQLALGTGTGTFAPDAIEMPRGAIATGHFDDDAYLDFVVGDAESGTFSIYRRDLEPIPIGWAWLADHQSQMNWNPIVVADLDGDARDDIVYAYDNGAVMLGYNGETTGLNGALDNMMWSTGPIRDLIVANVDGRYGLDIVYYRVDEPEPDDIRHSLCTMLSVDHLRAYGSPNCTRIDDGMSALDRAAFGIRGLAVDSWLGGGDVYYIAQVDGYTGNIQHRSLLSGVVGESFGFAELCNGGSPRSFVIGEIDGDPTYRELLAACDIDGYSEMQVWSPGFGYTDGVGHPFAGDALVAADFDGDGMDEPGGTQGTVDIGTGDGLLEAEPAYYEQGRSAGLQATATGNFTGMGEQLVTVNIYDDFDTYIEVHIENPTWGGWSTYSDRVCSDCQLGRNWHVRTAVGDLDDDGRDELALFFGAEGEAGELWVLRTDGDGNLERTTAPNVSVVGGEIAIAKVFPGRTNDIVIAGTQLAAPVLLVAHANGGSYSVTGLQNGSTLPQSIAALAAGDVLPEYPGAEVVLSERGGLRVYATVSCSGTPCLAHLRDIALGDPFENLHTTQLAIGDGPNAPIVALRQLITEGASWFELRRIEWDSHSESFDDELLAERDDLAYPCGSSEGECVPPAHGPFMVDFDHDGVEDIVVGWREGETWEVFGEERYLFAAHTRPSKFAELLDYVDVNIVLFDYETPQVWIIGQRN